MAGSYNVSEVHTAGGSGTYPKAVDADFSEVREKVKKETSNLPARLEDLQLKRHELLNGTVTEKISKAAEELAVDKELGLENQANETAHAALMSDIDQLTSSKDYFEVNPSILKKIFKFTKFEMDCLWYNCKEYWSARSAACMRNGSYIMAVIGIISLLFAWGFRARASGNMSLMGALDVVAWLSAIGFIAGSIVQFCQASFDHSQIKPKLEIKPLNNIQSRIPYGAKLKVLDAQRTKIFKSFVMAYPDYELHNRHVEGHKIEFNLDPAILGVTEDKRMFMITYWDIEYDVAHTRDQIKRITKFKLPKQVKV